MRTHALVIALAVAGCDDPAPAPTADEAKVPATAAPTGATRGPTSPASAAPTAVTARSAEPAPSASASASAVVPDASASSAPAPAPATLLGTIARASKVKVTAAGDSPLEAEIGDAKAIAALFASVGMDQEPTDGCPSCVPALRFVFSDAFGTRLGSLGWRCGDDETIAVVHDALANVCKRVTVADVEALRRIVDDLAK